MGLAEKRAVQEFKDQMFPSLKKELDEASGFELNVEVDWDSLAVEGKAAQYAQCFPSVFFKPLSKALRSICADEIGQTALKSLLKRVSISGTTAMTSPEFTNGSLVLKYHPCANVSASGEAERAAAIQKVLEKAL